jgi:hypothetical protein
MDIFSNLPFRASSFYKLVSSLIVTSADDQQKLFVQGHQQRNTASWLCSKCITSWRCGTDFNSQMVALPAIRELQVRSSSSESNKGLPNSKSNIDMGVPKKCRHASEFGLASSTATRGTVTCRSTCSSWLQGSNA